MVQNLVNIKNKFTGNCLIQSFNSNPILIQTLSRPKVPLDGEALDNKAFSLLARHQAAGLLVARAPSSGRPCRCSHTLTQLTCSDSAQACPALRALGCLVLLIGTRRHACRDSERRPRQLLGTASSAALRQAAHQGSHRARDPSPG